MNTRHLIIISLTILFLPLSITCINRNNREKNEIERVALGYIDATSRFDFDAARQYATVRTEEITLNHLQAIMPHVDSTSIENGKQATFYIKEVQLLTDSTAFAIYHKATIKKSYDDTLHLLKENNEWKVNLVIEIPPMLAIFADSTLWNSEGHLPDKEEMRKMKMNQKESQQSK